MYSSGNQSLNQNNGGKSNRSDFTCYYCGKVGHKQEFCYKKKRDMASGNVKVMKKPVVSDVVNACCDDQATSPINSPFDAFTPQQLDQLRSFLNKESSPSTTVNANMALTAGLTGNSGTYIYGSWIVDTGATHHMTSHRNWLNDLRLNNTPNHAVQLPNGHKSIASHIGSCQLNNGTVLSEVLLIPDFQYNLISVSKLTRDLGCVAVFYHDYIVFQDRYSGKVQGIGEQRDSLYILRHCDFYCCEWS